MCRGTLQPSHTLPEIIQLADLIHVHFQDFSQVAFLQGSFQGFENDLFLHHEVRSWLDAKGGADFLFGLDEVVVAFRACDVERVVGRGCFGRRRCRTSSGCRHDEIVAVNTAVSLMSARGLSRPFREGYSVQLQDKNDEKKKLKIRTLACFSLSYSIASF